MSGCLRIALIRGLRPLFLAALAALAWLVFGAGTASAATAESGSSLNLSSGAVTSDGPAASDPSVVQVLPLSSANAAPPVTEVVGAVVPVTEVVGVVAPVVGAAAPITEVVGVVESSTEGLVGAVDALVAPVLSNTSLPTVPAVRPPVPLPQVAIELPVLPPRPDRTQLPRTLETAPVPLHSQQTPEEATSEAAPGPSLPLTGSEGLPASALALFTASPAATPPATSASATTYAPPDKQPAPIPFQLADQQGLSPSGSSGNGGIAPPGAADVTSAWSAPAATHSGQIPDSALQAPPAPSFDPGSRPD
ncbi:hypothetical protein [Arthrobacter sp. ISL-30]|uniref:hypothetical protein n=1 Tax=Arthrobacter sp. ISL-30 TaxID=2819109 RepID=UPI001BEACA4B|nr:hypothetical protein [Arthrobacter sp. ISL-30]MBT2513527.1 hypothetical protein [Arthrobacter sp. ISL-30]